MQENGNQKINLAKRDKTQKPRKPGFLKGKIWTSDDFDDESEEINSLFYGMNKRIEVNPQIMTGKPVIKGTRIPIAVILNLLANGYTVERIIEAYPPLTLEDIKAALEH